MLGHEDMEVDEGHSEHMSSQNPSSASETSPSSIAAAFDLVKGQTILEQHLHGLNDIKLQPLFYNNPKIPFAIQYPDISLSALVSALLSMGACIKDAMRTGIIPTTPANEKATILVGTKSPAGEFEETIIYQSNPTHDQQVPNLFLTTFFNSIRQHDKQAVVVDIFETLSALSNLAPPSDLVKQAVKEFCKKYGKTYVRRCDRLNQVNATTSKETVAELIHNLWLSYENMLGAWMGEALMEALDSFWDVTNAFSFFLSIVSISTPLINQTAFLASFWTAAIVRRNMKAVACLPAQGGEWTGMGEEFTFQDLTKMQEVPDTIRPRFKRRSQFFHFMTLKLFAPLFNLCALIQTIPPQINACLCKLRNAVFKDVTEQQVPDILRYVMSENYAAYTIQILCQEHDVILLIQQLMMQYQEKDILTRAGQFVGKNIKHFIHR